MLDKIIKLKKGNIFWYRSGGKIYGAIVLDTIKSYYLIALTDELAAVPVEIDSILSAELYTVAWFPDLEILLNNRMHIIGEVRINGDFNERAGALICDQKIVMKNIGQKDTWKHSFRSFARRDTTMDFVLDPDNLPRFNDSEYHVF